MAAPSIEEVGGQPGGDAVSRFLQVAFNDDGSLKSGVGADKLGLAATAVKTGPYTAAVGDLIPVDTTSGNVTVTLPAAPADKTVVAVKHVVQGGTNKVTIACSGSDVFNKAGGATSATLVLAAQAILLHYRASTAIWYVVADDLPLAQIASVINAKGYGSIGDGTVGAATGTDNTTAIATAVTAAGTGTVFFPDGLYRTTVSASTLSGPFDGYGRVITTESGPAYNARGKFFNAVKSQPATLAWPGTGVDDAFNGDLSHVPIVLEHRTSGADTLGSAAQVASGYTQISEAGPFLGYFSNSSGRSGAGSSGRTGIWFLNLRLKQEAGAGGDIAALCVAAVNAGATATGNTTATGVNAINSATLNVGSTAGFPASGTAYLAGVAFTYTGLGGGGTTFTGCGNHAATTGGETVKNRWDQNASVGAVAGAMIGGADGVYLDTDEVTVRDGISPTFYDVSGVGMIRNFIRNKDTAALGQFWNGVRLQSTGDATHGNVDVGFMAYGTTSGYMVGLDLSAANLTASGTYNNAAVTLKAEQRVYFNASGSDAGGLGFYRRPDSTGTEWIDYHAATTSFRFVVGSATALQVSATQVTAPNNFQVTGAMAAALDMGSHKITSLTAGSSGTTNAASMANSLDQFAVPAANVSMNSNKLTSLAAATAAGDAVRYEQLVGSPSGAMGELLFPGVVDVQVFGPTASATWTKPAGATHLIILAIGAGGGGGGGVGGAASLFGGSGGGSGDAVVAYLPIVASMSNSVTVQVGAGGAGGTGSATSTGNAGSAGSRSTIFDTGNSTVVAPVGGGGGGGGVGAGAAGAAGGAATITTYSGLTISSTDTAAGAGAQSNITTNAATGSNGSGAAGSGITSGGAVAGSGGANGTSSATLAAATAASVAGAAGAVLGNFPYAAFGSSTRFGGGGGAAITGASTAGAGGAGYCGGGGGGGGTSRSGTGGAGGKGGDGRLVCISLA